jgi:hypothetical protein
LGTNGTVDKNIKPSELRETGFTKTSDELREYIERLVVGINEHLPGARNLIASLWSYRHNGHSFVSLDIQDDQSVYAVTMAICSTTETANYDQLNDPVFKDISELLHMVGLLAKAMNMKITVGLEENHRMYSLEEPYL